MEASEVQTNLKIWREPLQIEFKDDSLTYMERLWLKKHRRNPLHCAKDISLETELSPCIPISEPSTLLATSIEDMILSEKDDSIGVEVLKESYPDPFLPQQPELENIVSSVRIVELDENFEQEPGESGDFVPYKVELADTDNQQSWAVHQYQKNDFHFGKDLPLSLMKVTDAVRQHGYSAKDKDVSSQCSRIISSASKDTLKVSLSRSSTSDSPRITERVSTVSSEKNVTKKKNFILKNRKPDEKIHSSHQRTPYHHNVDLRDSHCDRLTYNSKGSLEGNSLHENSNSHEPRSMKSSKLQKIALRSKPIKEQYQGLEKFFVFGKNSLNERYRLNLATKSEINPSKGRITLTGNQQWISESSLSEHADDSIVQDVVWNNQKKVSGHISKRPSSANIPICKVILNGSQSHTSLHQRPRSAVSRAISRATSEISEIEYLDVTDHNEPFLDDAADNQTLDNLERELNTLRDLSDASEKLYNSNSEKLSGISRHSEKISKTKTDTPKTPRLRGSNRFDISSLDDELNGLLSSLESDIDDEEDNSLEKLQVIALH